MLSEERVIHMTKMEIQRRRNEDVMPLANIDKRDYISFFNVLGFLMGTAFYGAVVSVVIVTVLLTMEVNFERHLMISVALAAVIGYLVFIFLYQRWFFRNTLGHYQAARKRLNRWRNDWNKLAEIYENEKAATKPTVNMDVLFPEGSLGEKE